MHVSGTGKSVYTRLRIRSKCIEDGRARRSNANSSPQLTR